MACPFSSPCAACAIVSIVGSCVSRVFLAAKLTGSSAYRPIMSTRCRAGGCKRCRRGAIEPGILLLLHPGGEFGVVHHPHCDRHEGVVLAAQFRALAVEAAFAGRLEPSVVES